MKFTVNYRVNLKHIQFFLVFYIFIYMSCTSTPLLVQNGNYLESSEPYYKISFLAYGRGTLLEGKKSIAGHASISIERSGVWGFYPDIQGKLVTKHGILRYSTEYPITQDYTDFLVDENTMNKILELIAEWENNPPHFIISVNDCVSFIYRVCDIMGLRYNHFTLLPISAVRKIGNLNDHYRIYKTKG